MGNRNINDYEVEIEGSGERCIDEEKKSEQGVDEEASAACSVHVKSNGDTGLESGVSGNDNVSKYRDTSYIQNTEDIRVFEEQQARKDHLC